MHTKKSPRGRLWSFCWKAALSVILLAFLITRLSWREILLYAARMTPVSCLLAAACVVLAVSLSVLKWGLLLRGLDVRFHWRTLWQLYWSGYFLNQFAPGGLGADGYRIYQMGRRYRLSQASAYSVAMERILATVSLGGCGCLGYALLGGVRGYLPLMALVLLAGLALFFLLMGTGLRLPGKGKLAAKGNRWLEGFNEGRMRYREHPGCLAGALVVTTAFHGANFLLQYVLLSALAPGTTFIQAWVLNAGISVLSMLPVSINGFGVREFSALWIGGALGLSSGALVAASLLFAFFVMAVTLYGGVELLLNRNRPTAAPMTQSKPCVHTARDGQTHMHNY